MGLLATISIILPLGTTTVLPRSSTDHLPRTTRLLITRLLTTHRLTTGRLRAIILVRTPTLDLSVHHVRQLKIIIGNGQQHFDDMMHDINIKSNDNIQNNMNRGAAISELEMILEGERRRARDLKQQFESDLEGEKRMRVDFENKMIRLKEEAQKREMFISELE
jgi:hypothetical protein